MVPSPSHLGITMRRLLGLTALFILPAVASAVPLEITHSGRLLDTGGLPINTTTNLTLELWTAESNGTRQWFETHPSTVVSDGYFSVSMGSINILDGSDLAGNRWLQVVVGSTNALVPRQPLTSAPYARVAASVQQTDGTPIIDADGTIHVNNPSTCVSGTLRYDTNVLYYCDDTPEWVSLAGAAGSSQSTAAEDCQAILTAGASGGSGVYWIDPSGSDPFQAWCDMDTNGGGWTLCGKYDRDASGSYLDSPFARGPVNRQDLTSPFSFTSDQASQDCRALITAGATQILSAGSNGSLPWADGRINDILAEVISDPTHLWDVSLDDEVPEQASCTGNTMVTRTTNGVNLGTTDSGNDLNTRGMMVGDGAMWTVYARNHAHFSNAGNSVDCKGTTDDTVFWSWNSSGAEDHGCGSVVFGTGCSTQASTYRYNFMLFR